MKIEELFRLIKEGESQKVEFKRKAKNLAEEISAFANTGGGFIIIGVNDEGIPIGCNVKKSEEIISSSIQGLIPRPEVKIHKMKIGDKNIIVLEVKKSSKLVTVSGIAYIRIGTAKRPLSVQELYWYGIETGELKWDSQPTKILLKEAEHSYLKWFFERLKKLRGKRIKDRNAYLISVGAVKRLSNKLYLTNAGVLFFTKDPQKILQNSGLRIIVMDEKDEPVKQIEINGPIWKIADNAISTLQNLTSIETVTLARREKMFIYPMKAVREAVINALIHRNYGLEGDVRIFLHKNKLRIRNPGSLMPNLSLDYPEHLPRNDSLCKLMHDIGYVEKYGYGIMMIKKLIKEVKNLRVEFKPYEFFFEVVFEREMPPELDEIDRKILSVIKSVPRTSTEISTEIKLSKPATIARLKRMIAMGIIRKIGRGPKTKYVY